MPEHDDPSLDTDFEVRVRETAYFLWESAGRPQGGAQDYWFAALEQCTQQRDGDKPQASGDGTQADDNIDDLGRPLNDTGKSLDQPVSGTRKR